jgi:hypothetical protein
MHSKCSMENVVGKLCVRVRACARVFQVRAVLLVMNFGDIL